MTGADIRKDALSLIGQSGYNADEPRVVQYINRAMDLIVRDYNEIGKKKSTTFTITDANVSTWIDLPVDFIAEKRTYNTQERSTLQYAAYEPNGYIIENEQIRFDDLGEYTMEYIAMPEYMGNISETPNINQVYHPGISYYVASRITTEIYGDEESEKMMLLQQFNDYISKAYARLNTRKRRHIVKAPQWG